ncbi:MAG: hypothetical protein Q9195_002020 [Heterodermia aff. obscurata]
MEGLAVASSAAGLVSLGIEVCKGLLTYYQSWRAAESDVAGMYSSIETLAKTLILLDSVIKNGVFDQQIVKNVEKSILATATGLTSLKKKLDKIKISHQEDKWTEKTKGSFRRAIYPLKQSVLVKLKELAIELRDDLALALSVLQIDASASTLDRLDLLSDRVVDISNDINVLKEGVDYIAIDVKDLRDTTFNTSDGVKNLLFVQSTVEFERKQNELLRLEGRQDGIRQWFFGTAEFQAWIVESGKVMWCSGIQGAGKTVLSHDPTLLTQVSSLVIEHLRHRVSQVEESAVLYVYCNYKDVAKQTVTNLLSCLIRQLLLQKPHSVMHEVAALYESHYSLGTSPSVIEYIKVLELAVSRLATLYVVIDALDECSDEHGGRKTLISELSRLKLQLLVTSRDLPSIRRQFQNAIHLDICAREDDILNYIGTRINKSEQLSAHVIKDGQLQDVIRTTVASRAGGMFLQARLHLDSLATKTTLRKLKAALSTLPDGLTQCYDEVMQRISAQSNDNYQLARRVLYWVVNSVFPLALPTIQQALAVESQDKSLDKENIPDGELLVSVCLGLIEVHRDRGFVGLVHFTTQEYFERKGQELFPEAQEDILRTCLTFLSFEEFGNGLCKTRKDLKKRLQDYPFLAYSGKFAVKHKLSLGTLKSITSIHRKISITLLRTNSDEYGVCLKLLEQGYAYIIVQ